MLADRCASSATRLRNRLIEVSESLSNEAEAVVRQHPTEATDRDAARARYDHLLQTIYVVDLLRALVLVCDPRVSDVRQALDRRLEASPEVTANLSLTDLIRAIELHEVVCRDR